MDHNARHADVSVKTDAFFVVNYISITPDVSIEVVHGLGMYFAVDSIVAFLGRFQNYFLLGWHLYGFAGQYLF